MDMQKLTVGQMAELNNVSKQTLRLYDREELLKPAFIEEETGYRYYHINQSARLDLIQYLKTYGMTLREIRALLESNEPNAIRKLLTGQLKEIDDRINHLLQSRKMILRTLENYKRYEALPENGEIFLEFLPERKLYVYKCEENFFEQDDAGYEYMLRKLKANLMNNEIHISYFCNIGTIIRKENLEKNNMFSNEVFVFLDEEEKGATEKKNSGTYLCLCSFDFKDEEKNAKKLIAAAKERGYSIAGDYLCEVIIDFPVMEFDKRKMFYKIQIPVLFD